MRLLALLLALGACASADDPDERFQNDAPTPTASTAPLYYLSLEASGALVTASVNGLPVYRSESPYGAAHSGPVNDLLVGEGNRLTVRLAPADPAAYAEAVAGGMDPLDGVFLAGAVVRYPPTPTTSRPT